MLIELFAHDLGTLAYFCREVDRPSGKPVLPTMVAEGISVTSYDPVLLKAAQEIAKATLRLGPPALDAAALLTRRYAITDLAAALRSDTERNVLLAVGSALYGALGDFALRAEGHWSASGKVCHVHWQEQSPSSLNSLRKRLTNSLRGVVLWPFKRWLIPLSNHMAEGCWKVTARRHQPLGPIFPSSILNASLLAVMAGIAS